MKSEGGFKELTDVHQADYLRFHLAERTQMLVDTKKAAQFLNVSPRTLERMRTSGIGPVFIKMAGAVRYREDDIQRWLDSRAISSTSAPITKISEALR